MKILIGDKVVEMNDDELREHYLKIQRGELNMDGTPNPDFGIAPNPSMTWEGQMENERT